MTEKLVSVETEGEKMGARIESKIIAGERVVIVPTDREKLRGALERKGVGLQLFDKETLVRLKSVPEGIGRTSRQAKELETALGGEEQFVKYCQEILLMTVSEGRRDEANGFVENYVEGHTKEGYLRFGKKADLLKNRLEAIISLTHNLFGVIAEFNDGEAERVMNEDEFVICVREKVLRGWEKSEKVIVPVARDVPRREEEIIRTMPVGGLKKIIEYWVE